MDYRFNEYLREQFGGRWTTKDGASDCSALFAMAYGNALARFLEQHHMPVTKETCGNNVRVTLNDPDYDALTDLAFLLTTPGQPHDPDTQKPFTTLGRLMLHESGLAQYGFARG